MFLEGERVRLRPLETGDAERFQSWINEPEKSHYVGRTAYQVSLPAEEEFIRSRQLNDWEHGVALAIEATDGEAPRLIGNVELRGLHAESRRAELGILIGERESWGRGYGEDVVRTICRFGFDDLDLHRIELEVEAYNPRAQRCYEKVGFVVEGRKREHRYVAGRYHDTVIMGLLRSDFRARQEEQ